MSIGALFHHLHPLMQEILSFGNAYMSIVASLLGKGEYALAKWTKAEEILESPPRLGLGII